MAGLSYKSDYGTEVEDWFLNMLNGGRVGGTVGVGAGIGAGMAGLVGLVKGYFSENGKTASQVRQEKEQAGILNPPATDVVSPPKTEVANPPATDGTKQEDEYKNVIVLPNSTGKPGIKPWVEGITGGILGGITGGLVGGGPGPIIDGDSGTNSEIEVPTNGVDYMSVMKELQQEQWAREDAIRRETQQREDNAYQRAVADMEKAGINPNLVGVNAAQSGGGITQATGAQTNLIQAELQSATEILVAELNNALKGDEGQKDRLANMITKFATLFALMNK